jgi:hypothetical protein
MAANELKEYRNFEEEPLPMFQVDFGHLQLSEKHRKQLLKFAEVPPPYLYGADG